MGRVPFTELAPLAKYSIEKVMPLRIISFTVGFSLVRKPSNGMYSDGKTSASSSNTLPRNS